MKPLPTAPFTDEDWEIWWARPGFAHNPTLWCTYNGADRRDAELMLGAQRQRHGHWGPVVHYRAIEADRYVYIRFGGALLGAKEVNLEAAINITYFA
jgi:hypothetical protein